jgi:hypothetical protein
MIFVPTLTGSHSILLFENYARPQFIDITSDFSKLLLLQIASGL